MNLNNNLWEVIIKMDDGCVINRIIEKDKNEMYKWVSDELSQLKKITSLYIDDRKTILVVHPDKIRNIEIYKL